MDLEVYLKNSIKKPKQNGGKVFVYNGNDQLVNIYSTIELGKAYFSMSNDAFYSIYGFNFIPEGTYWELSKRAARKM